MKFLLELPLRFAIAAFYLIAGILLVIPVLFATSVGLVVSAFNPKNAVKQLLNLEFYQ